MRIRQTKLILVNLILLLTLFTASVYATVYSMSELGAKVTVETPKVVLQSGTAGTSTIYVDGTSAKVSVEAPVTSAPKWWNINYNYRKQITIRNNMVSPLSSGYSVFLNLSTASLVSAGKMLANGDDLRIAYWNGASWLQLDRELIGMNTSSTQIWFKTQANIPASGSDGNYYVYYGNPSAGSPPANKSNVYMFWDDFDDGSLGSEWTVKSIGGGSHTVIESNSRLNITSHYTGDIWGTSDNFTYVYLSGYAGSLEVSAYVSAAGGLADWVKVGGVHLRDDDSTGTKNMQASPTDAYGLTNSHRNATGGSTEEDLYGSGYMIPECLMLRKNGDVITPLRSEDGQSWASWASDTVVFTEPFLVGIPVCSMGNANTWVVIEWFKIRLYVDPEPSTILSAEENRYESAPPWWNSGWKYRRLITVTEKGIAARTDNPVDIYITFPNGHCYDPSIRILRYNGAWIEIPSQVWNKTLSGSFITSCTVSFIVDSIAQSGSAQYYCYYADTNQGEGSYANISIADNASKWGYNNWIFINDKLRLYIRKSIVGTYVVDNVTGTSWNYTRTPDPNSYQSNYGQTGPYEIWGGGATTTVPTAKPIRVEIKQNMAGPKNATFIYYKGQKYIKLILKSNVNWTDNVWDIQGVFEVGTASAASWGTNNKYCRVYGDTGTIIYKTEGAVWVLSTMNDPDWYDNPGFEPSDLTDKEQIIYIIYGGPNLSQAGSQALIDIIENPLETSLSGETVTYDYVLKVANQVANNWKVNLRVYDSFNLGRLSSAKISLHDGTTSDQIIINGGVITQFEGPQYDLLDSATVYMSISNLQATSSGTSNLYVHLKIQVPNTSIYILYVITFRIT